MQQNGSGMHLTDRKTGGTYYEKYLSCFGIDCQVLHPGHPGDEGVPHGRRCRLSSISVRNRRLHADRVQPFSIIF